MTNLVVLQSQFISGSEKGSCFLVHIKRSQRWSCGFPAARTAPNLPVYVDTFAASAIDHASAIDRHCVRSFDCRNMRHRGLFVARPPALGSNLDSSTWLKAWFASACRCGESPSHQKRRCLLRFGSRMSRAPLRSIMEAFVRLHWCATFR